jgi:hypothetical protein
MHEGHSWNRVFSGNPLHRRELVLAGAFALMWFIMDAVQWVDWLESKISSPPAPVVCTAIR